MEKFLDTPVKRYSSGMYVRLAFAVAAHLEPEILIVDEVLAVGDAQFQKKCLGKMEEVSSKEGRTVIFVSHNMGTVTELCKKGIYLVNGQMAYIGEANAAVSKYLARGSDSSGHVNLLTGVEASRQTKKLFFESVTLLDHNKMQSTEQDVREPFYVEISYEVMEHIRNAEISVRVDNSDGKPLFTTNQSDCSPEVLKERKPGNYIVQIKMPSMFLMPGSYYLSILAHTPMVEFIDKHEQVMSFTIAETGSNFAKYSRYHESFGMVMLDLVWSDVLTQSSTLLEALR